jgi:methyl-accepting chemotaxis protein
MTRRSLDPSQQVRDSVTDFATGNVEPAQQALVHTMNDLMELHAKEAHAASDAALDSFRQAAQTVAGVLGVGVLLAVGVAFALGRGIGQPLRRIQRAARAAAEGDLSVQVDVSRKDEVGQVAQAFGELVAYLREVATIAEAVAGGDLTRDFKAKSENDTFGTAIAGMVSHLRELVGQLQATSARLHSMSSELNSVASEADDAVTEVTSAVQTAAEGASETSLGAASTSEAVEQLARAVDDIARGASDQARQVDAASATASAMADGVARVAESASGVTAASEQTRTIAHNGARAVEDTVAAMAEINTTSASRLEDRGPRATRGAHRRGRRDDRRYCGADQFAGA